MQGVISARGSTGRVGPEDRRCKAAFSLPAGAGQYALGLILQLRHRMEQVKPLGPPRLKVGLGC